MNKNTIYIFDLDGVITKTAEIHYECWKETFEEMQQNFRFNREIYKKYFDGVSREAAINNFINENKEIKCNKKQVSEIKNIKYIAKLKKEKKENIMYEDSEIMIKKILANGNQLGLATSSKNSQVILDKIGYANIFNYIIDGIESEKMNLKSKPSPDIFNYCIKKLKKNYKNEEIVIIEDSISGVRAGIDSIAEKIIWIQRDNFDIKTEKEIKFKSNKLKIVKSLKEEI
jgi:beta-phosphoglucomutase-like phosphatase (HAD superfamily)